ncbi:MAG: hypothetical protein FWD29_06525 [Micrococcales bacterium]|nr:hypothetical protein [Micrococcales bacterium]
MTAWLTGLLALTVAGVWLWLPGAAVAFLAGLRGLSLLAMAPALSLAVIGCGSVVAPILGLGWSWLTALLATALACALAALVGWFFPLKVFPSVDEAATGGGAAAKAVPAGPMRPGPAGQMRAVPAPPLRAVPAWSWRQWRIVGLVALGAMAVIGLGALTGMGGLGAIPQGWDVVFHGNLVQFIADSANASPLHAGVLNSPEATSAYYPSTVHALAALLPSACQVWPALLAVQLISGSVVWVVGVTYLMQVLFPKRFTLAVIGVALAAVGQGQPLSLVGLIPNSVAVALLPALLGWSVQLARLVTLRMGGVVGRLLVLGVAALGLGLAHPIGVFSYWLLAWPISGYILGTLALRGWRRGWRLATVVCSAAVVALFALAVVLLLAVPEVKRLVSGPGWASRDNPLAALALAMGDSTSLFQVGPGLGLSLGLVCGAVLLVVRRRQRWLVASYLSALVIYVGCVTGFGPMTPLTGLWYSDRTRIGPLLGLIAIPIAAIGLAWVGSKLLPRFSWGLVGFLPNHPQRREIELWHNNNAASGRAKAWRIGLAALTVVCLASSVVTMALRPGRYGQYGYGWSTEASPRMLTRAELEMIRRLDQQLGTGKVLGDPANGSAYIYSLTGRQVVFPHLTGNWGQARRYLMEHLPSIASDPKVCQALDQIEARYLYLDPVTFRDVDTFASMT